MFMIVHQNSSPPGNQPQILLWWKFLSIGNHYIDLGGNTSTKIIIYQWGGGGVNQLVSQCKKCDQNCLFNIFCPKRGDFDGESSTIPFTGCSTSLVSLLLLFFKVEGVQIRVNVPKPKQSDKKKKKKNVPWRMTWGAINHTFVKFKKKKIKKSVLLPLLSRGPNS